MTISDEKQQPYNNETNNEKQEWKSDNRATIIHQSFNNEKPMKHTNETRQWNSTMKNDI